MKSDKIAAALAFVIGAMAIFAGGQVIFLGKEMNYHVINWLPYYNFAVGLITTFVTSILLWQSSWYARLVAITTFAAHAIVMSVLLVSYKNIVAPESIKAMTVRLVVWAFILALLYFHFRTDRQQSTT